MSGDEGEDSEGSEDEASQESSASSYHPSPVRKRRVITEEEKQRAVAFWKSGKTKKLKLATVQKSFRFVTSLKQLYDWENQQQASHISMSKRAKHKQISNHVYEKFFQSREQGIPVHDEDLRIWALERSSELQITDFVASPSWVQKFKNRYNIVSRKITKFVGRITSHNAAQREAAIASFIAEICPHATKSPGTWYNSDQSGFQKEMHSRRSLNTRGIKKVEAAAQSKYSMTHSYTIQPVISADGRLLSPMPIILQEPTGEFGPRVRQTMFTPDNLYIQATKSGKLQIIIFGCSNFDLAYI